MWGSPFGHYILCRRDWLDFSRRVCEESTLATRKAVNPQGLVAPEQGGCRACENPGVNDPRRKRHGATDDTMKCVRIKGNELDLSAVFEMKIHLLAQL